MAAYLSPGVFVEEIDSGARPIEAVGTSTAGFVGAAPQADAHVDEAFAINNWAQFQREFVGEATTSNALANAVYGFFLNGGSRCYVVNTKGAISGKGRGLDLLACIDEVAIIAAPGMTDAASYAALLDSAELLKDRVAILDAPATSADVEALTRAADGDGAAPAGGGDGGKSPPAPKRPAGLRPRDSDGGYGAFYFPWLRARDAITDEIVAIAPSGHIAGVYARTDTERGVHKAPANEAVRGAIGVTQNVSRAEQDVLNPAGVNCIRFFSREGVRIWGARTLAPSASNWRYLNVRRLFNMMEESIAGSTRWVVFEPNDRRLWDAVRRTITMFLRRVWRSGALFGRTPEEAFFVKCDEENNPPENRDVGILTVDVGIAPVKPAEFVVFRLSQFSEGAALEE